MKNFRRDVTRNLTVEQLHDLTKPTFLEIVPHECIKLELGNYHTCFRRVQIEFVDFKVETKAAKFDSARRHLRVCSAQFVFSTFSVVWLSVEPLIVRETQMRPFCGPVEIAPHHERKNKLYFSSHALTPPTRAPPHYSPLAVGP